MQKSLKVTCLANLPTDGLKQNKHKILSKSKDTVDGWEIRRSPVEGQVVFPIIYRVSAPSQVVVWDFLTINSRVG